MLLTGIYNCLCSETVRLGRESLERILIRFCSIHASSISYNSKSFFTNYSDFISSSMHIAYYIPLLCVCVKFKSAENEELVVKVGLYNSKA